MEDSKARLLVEELKNRNVTPEEHQEAIDRFDRAGRIGRWIIRRREPEAYRHYQRELERREYRAALQSIADARINGAREAGNIIIS
jgi:hypothetical protein